jgi:hypothetical protein
MGIGRPVSRLRGSCGRPFSVGIQPVLAGNRCGQGGDGLAARNCSGPAQARRIFVCRTPPVVHRAWPGNPPRASIGTNSKSSVRLFCVFCCKNELSLQRQILIFCVLCCEPALEDRCNARETKSGGVSHP